MQHNVIKDDAITGMMQGIKLATDLIRPTYGGNGSNIIIESKLRPGHIIANDAQSIVQSIHVKDHAQKIGLDFVKELCDKADKVSGDGRKTTLILLDTLLEEGYKSEMNKNQLRKELNDLIPFIESEIDKQTTQITIDDVEAVATTASESPEIGKLFQEIYKQIGKNGILTIEGSKTYETSYKMTNGVRFDMTGMLSPAMAHGDKVKAIYDKPLILVTKKKITNDSDINPLLWEMKQAGNKDLVIFTNDMDSGVASMLVGLHKSKDFNILIIKAPILWQDLVFQDFAKCVGATIVEDSTGKNFKNLQMSDLGTCEHLEVDSEETILTGIKDISEHIEQLKAKGDNDSLLSLSWLATKSAVLKLGANSETELSYKLLKANDANRSTYLALQHGVVRGGGICLWDVGGYLPDTISGNIIGKAVREPLNQQWINYGLGKNDTIMDKITPNIIDASMVVKMAVRNAIGIASTILTAPAIVHIPEKTSDEMQYEISMRQSNPFGQN